MQHGCPLQRPREHAALIAMGNWDVGIGTITGSLGLAVSGLTFWLTVLSRGRIKMTRPTFIAFVSTEEGPKVFLRGMLHSTARRGNVLENMYVTLTRKETKQIFNIWVYGEHDAVARGSGLYIGQEGVAFDHHFALPVDTTFDFLPGNYLVEVFATLVGKPDPVLLSSVSLAMTEDVAAGVMSGEFAAFFNWGPDSRQYHAHLDDRPRRRARRARSIETVVRIDLMASDHPVAEVKDGRVDYYFPIRVLNAGPFPVRVKDLFIRWMVGGDMHDHGNQRVEDEFKSLMPGEFQKHDVTIHGAAYTGTTLPQVCRISFGGSVVAESEGWPGQARYELASAVFTFGVVIDQRSKKPA